jgi:hypothetical protein
MTAGPIPDESRSAGCRAAQLPRKAKGHPAKVRAAQGLSGIRGAHGVLVQMEIRGEFAGQSRDCGRRETNDEVEVMCRSGNAPIVAGHRTGQQVLDGGSVEPSNAIDEQFAFGHVPWASARR